MINPTPESKNDIRIKRLIYQSWHRGCKETDLALGDFAKDHLNGLSAPSLDTYEQLLEENDWDIWNWLTEKDTPKPEYSELIAMIRAHARPES